MIRGGGRPTVERCLVVVRWHHPARPPGSGSPFEGWCVVSGVRERYYVYLISGMNFSPKDWERSAFFVTDDRRLAGDVAQFLEITVAEFDSMHGVVVSNQQLGRVKTRLADDCIAALDKAIAEEDSEANGFALFVRSSALKWATRELEASSCRPANTPSAGVNDEAKGRATRTAKELANPKSPPHAVPFYLLLKRLDAASRQPVEHMLFFYADDLTDAEANQLLDALRCEFSECQEPHEIVLEREVDLSPVDRLIYRKAWREFPDVACYLADKKHINPAFGRVLANDYARLLREQHKPNGASSGPMLGKAQEGQTTPEAQAAEQSRYDADEGQPVLQAMRTVAQTVRVCASELAAWLRLRSLSTKAGRILPQFTVNDATDKINELFGEVARVWSELQEEDRDCIAKLADVLEPDVTMCRCFVDACFEHKRTPENVLSAQALADDPLKLKDFLHGLDRLARIQNTSNRAVDERLAEREEWSVPMPLTELANRLNNISPRKARTILKPYGLKPAGNRQSWTVRLDTMPGNIRHQIEAKR